MSNWNLQTVSALFDKPFNDLLFEAQTIHRQHFPANEIQLSTLLSIKTGTCPEDCAYCPQSGHYQTYVNKGRVLPLEEVLKHAQAAKDSGSTRFCMGAAWKNPPEKDFPQVLEMIKAVKALGLETCATLGMLDDDQTTELKSAGLDYYNHNLDTSPEHYKKIISTRTYQDRLDTLERVRDSGMNVCCGGIIGMGESREDRAELIVQLANLPKPPESVPINRLIAVKGTPLENTKQIDNIEFIRTIAVCRIVMPTSRVRLSAGRSDMSEEMHALCFMAGANSIFFGDVLLTAENPSADQDVRLLNKLGIKPQVLEAAHATC